MSLSQSQAVDDSVLVVDDDQAASESLASVLESNGMQVFLGSDANEALALAEKHHPGVVVVDHQLGQNTGVDTARRLKEQDADRLVLLLTGLAALDAVLPAVEELDGLLVKPLVPQAFVQTVRNALTQRALAVENRRLVGRIEQLATQDGPTQDVAAPGRDEHPSVEPPDRAEVEARLNRSLEKSRRADAPLAVLMIEISGVQGTNEALGHPGIEQAIDGVASRLSVARRKSDVVARIANDRFVIACAGVDSSSAGYRIATTVRDAVAAPVVVDGDEGWLTGTVGFVRTDPASATDNADDLLQKADIALHYAKEEGLGAREFDQSMRDRMGSRHDAESGLRKAMEEGEFTLFYQPVVDLQSSKVVAAEALLRWQRPGQGVVLPRDFLGIGDELGLAPEIGRWTLDRALSEFAGWRQVESVPDGFRLVLNVSARELADPEFFDTLERFLDKHEVPPAALTLDLTDRALREVAAADHALERLSEAGLRLNLEDFGAAEAKLEWLQNLPMTSLKIAPNLVTSLDASYDADGAAMVRAVIALGHELHLSIIGKGVETSAQAAALRAMGCDMAQGYHFGPPGPAEQLLEAAGATAAGSGEGDKA